MKKGREEKTKFSKILPNNQIITACRIELQVREMTMNKKVTMIGLMLQVCYAYTERFKHNDCFLKTKQTFTICTK